MDYTKTEVHLLNVPLDSENNHTYYFSSKDEQVTYFLTKLVKSYTNLTYQRKDNNIRIPEHIDKINNCNYVMYRNTTYSNKWYFAFVKDLIYVNDERTDIVIETDPLQTYLFDYTLGKCFVEREHVTNDSIGLHTIPEMLETGEYICNGFDRDLKLRDYVYVMLVTEFTNGDIPNLTNFGGIPAGYGGLIFDDYTSMAAVIDLYAKQGKSEAIIAVYMLPSTIIEKLKDENRYYGQSSPITYLHDITKPTTIDGYTPINNKLLSYPYQYLILSNNAGSSNILQFEHFKNDLGEISNTCSFEIEGIPVIGGSIKCVPLNYKGCERFQEEGIMCGKFPTLSWSADLYTNWLTQNAVNIAVGTTTSAASIVGGIMMIATGGGAGMGVGMIAGGLMGITNQMQQVHQQSFTPNSAKGNVNGGDINTAYKMNTFYFLSMSIKKEYAKSIDNYFNMYGYKVNELKVPNKNHRAKYWFTKTIDANIQGAIPKKDIQRIIDIYNKGVTFWRTSTTFRNYDNDNTII